MLIKLLSKIKVFSRIGNENVVYFERPVGHLLQKVLGKLIPYYWLGKKIFYINDFKTNVILLKQQYAKEY